MRHRIDSEPDLAVPLRKDSALRTGVVASGTAIALGAAATGRFASPGITAPVNAPLTSTIRWVALLVKTHTLPSGPIRVSTLLATVWPAAKLRFDASGRGEPHGFTVTKPAVADPVAVMFNTASDDSIGVPPRLFTISSVTELVVRCPRLR